LILEAPHVFVEELTIESIAQIKALYEHSDLRPGCAASRRTRRSALSRMDRRVAESGVSKLEYREYLLVYWRRP